MAKHGKRYLEAAKLVDPEKQYAPLEAAALVKKTANTKFDQTVEVHIRLGVDPRQSEEAVRGTVGLPHGTGKNVRVAVFAQGAAAEFLPKIAAIYAKKGVEMRCDEAAAGVLFANDAVKKVAKIKIIRYLYKFYFQIFWEL